MESEAIIQVSGISINTETQKVFVDTRRVYLTGSEFKLLVLLVRKKGTVVTKRMIFDHLYPNHSEPELKIIDVFICKLRKKIEAVRNGVSGIDMVWGRGYIISEPDNCAVDKTRWVVSRKRAVLQKIMNNPSAKIEIMAAARLSKAELNEWQTLHRKYGEKGLRTTKLRRYPTTYAA